MPKPIPLLQPRRGGKEEEMVITTLPFPMSIPVDNNLKSLVLSVDVVLMIGRDIDPIVVDSKTMVASKSVLLIGGDTALTVDVSDLPQKTKGEVTVRTEAASRSQCFISFE